MMKLYHTGYEEIRQPDIRHGRKNADFGQGFYMSRSDAFAGKWAREKKGSEIIVNSYELEEEGLSILQLTRDETWYDYLFRNRTGQEDLYPEADVIIGPIANDTIYDTLGIFTSGFLSRDLSLQLLKVGPEYEQVVLKTQKAAAALRWISSRVMESQAAARFRQNVLEEQEAYQKALADLLNQL